MLPVTPVTDETPAYAPHPFPQAYLRSRGTKAVPQRRDPPAPRAPALASASASAGVHRCRGPGAGARGAWGVSLGWLEVGSRSGTVPLEWWGWVLQHSGVHAEAPWLREEGASAGPPGRGCAGAWGPGRPLQAAASSGDPGSPRRQRLPTPSAPAREAAPRGEGPRPRAARLHLRTWDAGQRVPGSPSHSSGLPGSGPAPGKAPRVRRPSQLLPREGRPRRWGRVRRSGGRAAAARRGSGACTAAPAPTSSSSGSAPPSGRAPRVGRAPARPSRPRAAGSAGCQQRVPQSRLPSVLGRGRWGGGGGGERERERD